MGQQAILVETPKMDGFAAIVAKDTSELIIMETDAPVRLPKYILKMCFLGDDIGSF